MKKSLSISLTLLLLLFSVSRLHAADFVLFNWGFNIDGTTYCFFPADESQCDFGDLTGSGDLPSFIDTSGFNFATGLGSISITISNPGSHSVLVFVDHDIDGLLNDYFNEKGVANGSPAAGQTWEIDEPSFGSLQNGSQGLPYIGDISFDNFLLDALDNQVFFDAVDNQTLIPPVDDVSMAMGRDFDLVEGETATVVFLLSETSEPQGFYLKHSDPDSDADIYFSSSLDAESILYESGVQAFVTRFYQQCLNRDPDQAGLDYWVNALLGGTLTGADVAYGFVFSQEFTSLNTSDQDYLTVLYRAFFDRQPDAGGLAYWLTELNNGASREDVLDGFTYAQEFVNLCDAYGIIAFRTALSPVEAFVTRFYQQCLNRDPDQGGLDYWVNALLGGTLTGADVAWGFVFSQEFTSLNTNNEDYLTVLYRAFFDRQPDPGGFAYWLSQFNSGMSREEALCGFLNSTEFGTLCYNYGIVFGGCGVVTSGELIITGTAAIPTDQVVFLPEEKGVFAFLKNLFVRTLYAFPASPLAGAHVNILIVQNGILAPLPGHPTVLADSSGKFSISVDPKDIPGNRQMIIEVTDPTGALILMREIPESLLPLGTNEVTTVSVDPDGRPGVNVASTIITRYSCSQEVLFFTPDKCTTKVGFEEYELEGIVEDYFERFPLVIPDIRDLGVLIEDIAYDEIVFPAFDAWRVEIPGLEFPDFVSGARNFTNCSWGSCVNVSCGDGICESDAGEDNASCPDDCQDLGDFMGSWSGSYNQSSVGDGGCMYYNAGNMNMTISVVGNSFSGSSSIDGVHLQWIPACSLYGYTSSSGSCSGSVSGTLMSGTCSYPIAETGGTTTFNFEATISGNTMNGTFGDTGSFMLTK